MIGLTMLLPWLPSCLLHCCVQAAPFCGQGPAWWQAQAGGMSSFDQVASRRMQQHVLLDWWRLLLQYFREKIRAEAEGKTYSVPPPSSSNAGSRLPPTGGMAARNGSSQSLSGRGAANRSSNNDDWDDWGDKKVSAAL